MYETIHVSRVHEIISRIHEIISRVHEIINEWAILILVLHQMTTKAIRVTYSLEVTNVPNLISVQKKIIGTSKQNLRPIERLRPQPPPPPRFPKMAGTTGQQVSSCGLEGLNIMYSSHQYCLDIKARFRRG